MFLSLYASWWQSGWTHGCMTNRSKRQSINQASNQSTDRSNEKVNSVEQSGEFSSADFSLPNSPLMALLLNYKTSLVMRNNCIRLRVDPSIKDHVVEDSFLKSHFPYQLLLIDYYTKHATNIPNNLEHILAGFNIVLRDPAPADLSSLGIVPVESESGGTFCIHSGIIPVGQFSRKCAKSINQA